MRSLAPLQRLWEYLGGSIRWWEEGENRLDGHRDGRGGRLSSGRPGVERAADGSRRLVGSRGLCKWLCRLSARNALQAVDGLHGWGRPPRSSLLRYAGAAFVGEILKTGKNAGPAVRQDGECRVGPGEETCTEHRHAGVGFYKHIHICVSVWV